jgi:hypothetical protein
MDVARSLPRALVDDEVLRALSTDRAASETMWAVAAGEMLDAYLAWRISRTGEFGWSHGATERARATLVGAAALEVMQRGELDRITSALADGGVSTLVMNGAAFAYSHYPQPMLRSRDIDLFVANGDRGEAERILSVAGYEPDLRAAATAASGHCRCRYRRRDRRPSEPIDLRWRIGDPLLFGDALRFADAWQRRVCVPCLCNALTLSAPDRLLLACLHRMDQRREYPALIWLLDIHLLAGSMTAPQWEDFLRPAATVQAQSACVRGLRQAVEWFGTTMPVDVQAWMQQRPIAGATVNRAQRSVEYRRHVIGSVWGWIVRNG